MDKPVDQANEHPKTGNIIGFKLTYRKPHLYARLMHGRSSFLCVYTDGEDCHVKPNDILWLREDFRLPEMDHTDDLQTVPEDTEIYYPANNSWSKKPPIHIMPGQLRKQEIMPRWASRLAIAVERVELVDSAPPDTTSIVPDGMTRVRPQNAVKTFLVYFRILARYRMRSDQWQIGG